VDVPQSFRFGYANAADVVVNTQILEALIQTVLEGSLNVKQARASTSSWPVREHALGAIPAGERALPALPRRAIPEPHRRPGARAGLAVVVLFIVSNLYSIVVCR
jgi:hypothetical protein